MSKHPSTILFEYFPSIKLPDNFDDDVKAFYKKLSQTEIAEACIWACNKFEHDSIKALRFFYKSCWKRIQINNCKGVNSIIEDNQHLLDFWNQLNYLSTDTIYRWMNVYSVEEIEQIMIELDTKKRLFNAIFGIPENKEEEE